MDAGEPGARRGHARRGRGAPRAARRRRPRLPARWLPPHRGQAEALGRSSPADRPRRRPRGARRGRARAPLVPRVCTTAARTTPSTARPERLDLRHLRGRGRAASRRHAGGHPEAPRRSTTDETAAADRLVRRAPAAGRVDGLGTPDEVTARLIAAIDARAREADAPMAGRTGDELRQDARGPAGSWPRCTSRSGRRSAPGSPPASSTGSAGRSSSARGARSNFLGYHGFPAVICASPNDVIVHGIPGDGRARARATSSRSTAAPSSTAGTATPPSPLPSGDGRRRRRERLIEVTERVAVGRHRQPWSPGNRLCDIGAGRPDRGRGRRASRWCGSTSATASARPCTRSPRCRTTAAGQGRQADGGNAFAVEPMVNAGRPDTLLLDDGWRW